MKTKFSDEIEKLARKFDVREMTIQRHDRREYFLRFEGGKCVGCYDMTWEAPMTDERALFEVEVAVKKLQKHYDAGFLLGIWNEQYDGVAYRCANGRYAELAEREKAA